MSEIRAGLEPLILGVKSLTSAPNAVLEPLGAARRADGVFEQLRSRILSGALPPGEQLPNERDLAAALQVNRASVREAVKRLEFLELVEVRHGQGTFVREVSAFLRDEERATKAQEMVRSLLQDAARLGIGAEELSRAFNAEAGVTTGE